MNRFITILGICTISMLVTPVIAQDKPGMVAAEVVETVVTVRAVDHQRRTVTVEGPSARLTTIKVPAESQNLQQVRPGAKFKVRYVQAVAVGVLKPGAEPSREAVEVMELAPRGATPGGAIVQVAQISGRIEAIDYSARTIVVRGDTGELREFAVGPDVERFESLKVGDVIALRVTDALAMRMIAQ
jgi:hypothetical protein